MRRFKAFLFSREFWPPEICGCGCSSWFSLLGFIFTMALQFCKRVCARFCVYVRGVLPGHVGVPPAPSGGSGAKGLDQSPILGGVRGGFASPVRCNVIKDNPTISVIPPLFEGGQGGGSHSGVLAVTVRTGRRLSSGRGVGGCIVGPRGRVPKGPVCEGCGEPWLSCPC